MSTTPTIGEMMEARNVETRGSRGGGRAGPRWAGAMAALLVGVIAGVVVALLVFDDDDGDEAPAFRPTATTLERIVDGPDEFVGDATVVSGVVREIISPRAFTITPPGLVGKELLVVSEAPLAAPTRESGSRPLLEGDLAQVSGDVRNFDVNRFERDTGAELRREFDSFVGDDLTERNGDPVIRARAVSYSAGRTPVVETRTAEEIVERPRDFYGSIVALEGRVSDVLPSGALVIDDQVLALTAEFGQGSPKQGQRVSVVGPVRPFDPDQFGARGDQRPDDELFGRFANRPAVVAQSIEIER